jgi:sugar lactone lactonase YvrE
LSSLASGCLLRSSGTADGAPLDPDARVETGDASVADAGVSDVIFYDAMPLTEGASTLAGAAEHGFVDGDRSTARFDDPVNCVVAPDGRVYVADFNNGAIRQITPEGVVTTVVKQPGFDRPFGMVFGADGTFYVETDRASDGQLSGALWTIDVELGVATLLEDGKGRFRGMALLSDGRLALADYQEHTVVLYDPATRVFTPLAGSPGVAGFADGNGTLARFDEPYDIVVLPGDILVVSDFFNHRLRMVTLAGEVSTLAGTSEAGSTDGTLAEARFGTPQGLARDDLGNVYISDPGAHKIRRMQGSNVTTVAGDGIAGYVDVLDPLLARFYGIEGLDVTPDGVSLYLADGNLGDGSPYHRVRRLQLDRHQ